VLLNRKGGGRITHRNGLRNQGALVEALNRLMAEWGEPVVADVGSAGKGRK